MLKNKKLKTPVPTKIHKSRILILRSLGLTAKMIKSIKSVVKKARPATVSMAEKPLAVSGLVKRPIHPHMAAARSTAPSPAKFPILFKFSSPNLRKPPNILSQNPN